MVQAPSLVFIRSDCLNSVDFVVKIVANTSKASWGYIVHLSNKFKNINFEQIELKFDLLIMIMTSLLKSTSEIVYFLFIPSLRIDQRHLFMTGAGILETAFSGLESLRLRV